MQIGSDLTEQEQARGPGTRSAGGTLVVMLVGLLTWTFLAAPRMEEAAEAHAIGARRTAALIVLRPITGLSGTVGLTTVTETVERAVGLDTAAPPGGGIDVPGPDPLPSVSGSPSPIPERPDPALDTPWPIRTPTPGERLRVVIVGDSMAAGMGYFAGRVLKPSLVRVLRQGRISTGLARPDYFDWRAAMTQIVQAYRPDLVIVMMGENDRQDLRSQSGRITTPIGTGSWSREYQDRVEDFMELATAGGARVMWVGLPSVRDATRAPFSDRANTIYAAAAADVGDVEFFDPRDLFDRRGNYTAFYRDGNRLVEVRADDGLHFTPDGYRILVREVARASTAEFGLDSRAYRT